MLNLTEEAKAQIEEHIKTTYRDWVGGGASVEMALHVIAQYTIGLVENIPEPHMKALLVDDKKAQETMKEHLVNQLADLGGFMPPLSYVDKKRLHQAVEDALSHLRSDVSGKRILAIKVLRNASQCELEAAIDFVNKELMDFIHRF